MLDHVSLAVGSLARSRAFYDAVLAPLGYRCLWATDGAAGYGSSGADEPFAIGAMSEAVVPASCTHIAFTAADRSSVTAFYEAAIASGGFDDGGVGLHQEYGLGYFAAFVRDADGNRLEAVVHER